MYLFAAPSIVHFCAQNIVFLQGFSPHMNAVPKRIVVSSLNCKLPKCEHFFFEFPMQVIVFCMNLEGALGGELLVEFIRV